MQYKHKYKYSVVQWLRVEAHEREVMDLPCGHNLAVNKSKIHRERVCRVFFAVSNTRQSLRHVRFGLCRVRHAYGEPPPIT